MLDSGGCNRHNQLWRPDGIAETVAWQGVEKVKTMKFTVLNRT
jgi:hypothetical protein